MLMLLCMDRQEGQGTAIEVRQRDLRAELDERERKSRKTTLNISFEGRFTLLAAAIPASTAVLCFAPW
jgi:hypothetical protein